MKKGSKSQNKTYEFLIKPTHKKYAQIKGNFASMEGEDKPKNKLSLDTNGNLGNESKN